MRQGIEPAGTRARALDVWVRRGCTLIVAGVAAYSSYEHQRELALRCGADATSATLWPLSVDGLLVLATVGLWRIEAEAPRRVWIAVWLSFLLGIAVSLAANIAAAPTLAWQPVLVAGWPPLRLIDIDQHDIDLLSAAATACNHALTPGVSSGSVEYADLGELLHVIKPDPDLWPNGNAPDTAAGVVDPLARLATVLDIAPLQLWLY